MQLSRLHDTVVDVRVSDPMRLPIHRMQTYRCKDLDQYWAVEVRLLPPASGPVQ